ncbi:MAG: dihydrofolate reductase [Oscillospiraceae bacterium]|nr:dihydrofolate reductase [Oscillospiraceae bacterium]MDD4367438.1 dihydrofolate reductase [Oscillospiraceae bacterium]
MNSLTATVNLKYPLTMLAAVDQNWALGREGRLLLPIKTDLRHFRRLTLNNVVILGRKTLDTFPGGQPLAKRDNIILSRSLEHIAGAQTAGSVEAALKLAAQSARPCFIIGGASIFRQFLPYCSQAEITRIDYSFPEADAFLPNLEQAEGWQQVSCSAPYLDTDSKLSFCFCRYARKACSPEPQSTRP